MIDDRVALPGQPSVQSLPSAQTVPFNLPHMVGSELAYVLEAYRAGALAGDGSFTRRSQILLERLLGAARALLTHSCTAALELAALALRIEPGDEIVMPSYTFASTANAFALRGAVPVFVDIRPDTLNIDESLIENALTSRTRAIVPVHYAGIACEMDDIAAIAGQHRLAVVEDAAQGMLASYRGRALGTIGDLGCLSFHETKNIISGEGGALLVNRLDLVERCEIHREKGTDRSRFFRGEVDKYTWCDLGSSYLPGEIVAAFLLAQLEHAQRITDDRLASWNTYHDGLAHLEARGVLRRPTVPNHVTHNGHMFHVRLGSLTERDALISYLKRHGVGSVFHYVPLHSSPAGLRFGRTPEPMHETDRAASTLIRLPLWVGIGHDAHRAIDVVTSFFTM